MNSRAFGGFTYNFKNPGTQYQSGIDFHFDWGASHFLSKQVFVGPSALADRIDARGRQVPRPPGRFAPAL
jgi:hypothetical protein